MEIEFVGFLSIYWCRKHSLISELKLQHTVIISTHFAHNSLNYIQADKLVKKTFITSTSNLCSQILLLFAS